MKSGSDSNGVEFMQKDQQKETTGSCSKIMENNQPNLPASDRNNEVLESPSPENGPSETLSADPTLVEASQMPKTPEEDAKVELESESAVPEGDQPQPDQTKSNSSDTSRSGHVTNDKSDSEKEESVSSPAGSDSSVGDDATAAHSALIMEATQSFSLALAEKMPQNGSYATQASHSEHEGNSGQANHLNTQTGSSLQAELQQPQPVEEPVDKGKKISFADEFEKNNNGMNHLIDNQPALHYPNLFPQNPSGIRFLNGESTQTNHQQQQQAPSPTCFSNKENDLYRHLAPGSQVNHQFKATNFSDPFCYNFILPTSSRPQQLANMPNLSGSLLQNSELTKHSLPMELMTQQFSYQHSQVPWELGSHNAQTFSTMFHETSSMPLSSAQLPAHDSQASNQFSMMPSLPSQDHHHTSELPENSLMSRLQQGLLTQTTRPIATYPSSDTAISSLIMNSSSLLQETVDSSAPHHMEPIVSSHMEKVNSGRRGHARSRVEQGESSSFKRLRRELSMPQASSDEQVNSDPLSLLNEVTSNPNIASLVRNPRPMLNSLYDPMFEGLGLPIDPHLRLFAKYMG